MNHKYRSLTEVEVMHFFYCRKTIPKTGDLVTIPEMVEAFPYLLQSSLPLTPYPIGRRWYNIRKRIQKTRVYRQYLEALPMYRKDYEQYHTKLHHALLHNTPPKYRFSEYQLATMFQQRMYTPRSHEVVDVPMILQMFPELQSPHNELLPRSDILLTPYHIGRRWHAIKKDRYKCPFYTTYLECIDMYRQEYEKYHPPDEISTFACNEVVTGGAVTATATATEVDYHLTPQHMATLFLSRTTIPQVREVIPARMIRKEFDIPQHIIVEDFKIGMFWRNIRQNYNLPFYHQYLSHSELYRNAFEKRKQLQLSEHERYRLTDSQMAHLMLTFPVIPPKVRDVISCAKIREVFPDIPPHLHVKDFQIGVLWNVMKNTGYRQPFYISYLQSNEWYYHDYQKTVEKKKKEQHRYKLTEEEIAVLFREMDHIPCHNENVSEEKIRARFPHIPSTAHVRPFLIGSYWNNLKQGCNEKFYQEYIHSIDLFRKNYEDMDRYRGRKDSHYFLSDAQMATLFQQWTHRTPAFHEVIFADQLRQYFPEIPSTIQVRDFMIGWKWYGIKKRKRPCFLYLHYLSKIPVFRNEYEKYWSMKSMSCSVSSSNQEESHPPDKEDDSLYWTLPATFFQENEQEEKMIRDFLVDDE